MGTISKALDLLNLFLPTRPEIGLGDFVRLSGRDKATVHRHLTELAENGFLEQDIDSRAYRLGPAVLRLSALRETLFPMRKILQPIVVELSQKVGELAHASLLQSDALSPLVHADPCKHGVQVHFDIAEMLPFHATSSGLAALAFSPEAMQERILSGDLARYTDHTIRDPDILRTALESAREHGVCTLAAAFDEGVSSVGAPLFGPGGRVIGALSVAVPTVRATPIALRRISADVLSHAEQASIALGGTFPKTFTPVSDDWASSAPTAA
ncbi:helix-turn-helix domain-containing protein [Rhodobacterales bacterium HKCCE4037]|nr:helix-turn-helix domain-containing protein [Rhodobacterales bacterium HKCCE4037]